VHNLELGGAVTQLFARAASDHCEVGGSPYARPGDGVLACRDVLRRMLVFFTIMITEESHRN
jgi:hypothetical protein